MTQTNKVPFRTYAHVFDRPMKESEAHGCDPSPDAIGGCFGIGWTEFFRDHRTGEVFGVSCSDGVNGGKSSHSDEDLMFRQECFKHIEQRTHQQVADDAKEIRISSHEWNLMMGFTHISWFESKDGARDGQQADRAIREGLIGHCCGIPVIVDLEKADDLPPR